jgi:FkbM family methyltransferase
MNALKFRNDLIESIYMGVYKRVEDNFDFFRYNYDGVDRSNELNVMANAKYLQFVLDNAAAFYETMMLFSDEESRKLFFQLVQYRCLGHPHFRISNDLTWTIFKQHLEQARTYVKRPSELAFTGVFGALQHHEDIPFEGHNLAIDAWSVNVAYGLGWCNQHQYYFQRGDINIQPEPGDFVVDGGACFGDTAVLFACSVGNTGRVFSFEPLPVHLEVVKYNVHQNGLTDRVRIIPAGVGETTNNIGTIDQRLSGTSNPGFSMRGLEALVPILSIDDMVKNEGAKSIDFIKMDVEGFELSALKGAAETIGKYKPKLAISLYHKPEDFLEIPMYLKSKYPFYRFYLDHYTIHNEETVLYATAN